MSDCSFLQFEITASVKLLANIEKKNKNRRVGLILPPLYYLNVTRQSW